MSQHNVHIFAEIVDAPEVSVAEILNRAERYRYDGADVIDIGCLPDTPFPHLEESVQALKAAGFKVSVDSLEENDLLRGGKAGADYLLSLKKSSLWIAEEVDSIPILIPETHADMNSLYDVIEHYLAAGKPFFADTILDPVHFGFTKSIIRYAECRERYPDIDMMMGIGNLTELTEADTSGINAMLFGLISEMDITAVLATEVSAHCRSAVREADMARRIMFAAKQESSLPKSLSDALTTTHLRKPFTDSYEEIQEMAKQVKDPSYRIQISEQGIHVYNRDGLNSAFDPFDLFPQLDLLQDDAPHAFYMGVELARAQIAQQLGRRYTQDEELDFGVAMPDKNRDEKNSAADAAHAIKQRKEKIYKDAGSTLKASRKKKVKAKSNDS